MRYKKYGGLEVNSKIARKTGAYNREELTEKDINYYDQVILYFFLKMIIINFKP